MISNINASFNRMLSQLNILCESTLVLDLGVSLRHLAEATLACPGILVTVACVALASTRRLVCQAPLPVLFPKCVVGVVTEKATA